jgi:DNA-binding MarR family transcriptional regulator
MNVERDLLIKEIVNGIRLLSRTVQQDSAKIGKRFGLTVAQGAILRNLALWGPSSSADLSRRLYVTPANITGIVDRLEKKGLVVRNRQQDDRRVILLTLTEQGEELGRLLPDPIEQRLISGLADMDSKRIRNLSTAVSQVVNLIEESDSEDDLWE